MKPTYFRKTQKDIKISSNPSFSKRGNSPLEKGVKGGCVPPFVKGGEGGFSGENITCCI